MTKFIPSSVNSRSPESGTSSRGWLAVLLIVIAVLLSYSNNYNNVFIFDDFDAIVNNPQIQPPISIQKLLSPDKALANSVIGRPVVALSFAWNYALGGLEVSGYHLVNNLIHLLAALALFGIVRCTLLLPRFSDRFGRSANWYAVVVALLWALHPIQTESVSYIVCRTESLVGFFYLLTIYFAAGGFLSARPRNWYIAAVAACVLGMGSKEIMVSAPLLVLLYDYLFVAGSVKGMLQQRRWFYTALFSSWLVLAFFQINVPQSFGVSFDDQYLSVLNYFRTQMTVITHYLQLVFWPHPLVLDSQDWPIVREWSPVLIIPAVILGSMAVLTVWGLMHKRWWSFPGVWFFAILAPTSSIIPLLGEIVSERRMYLPLAAVIVLVVFVGDTLWHRFGGRIAHGHGCWRLMPFVLAIMVAMHMGYKSWERNLDYRTAVLIWTDTVTKRPDNYRAHENLGKALLEEGGVAEAVNHLREAVRLYPAGKPPDLGLGEIYSSFGSALSRQGNFQEAIAMHWMSQKLHPDRATMPYRLGNTYLRANDWGNAAAAFRQALAIFPDYLQAHGNLALVLQHQGDPAGAEHHFRRVLELAPTDIRSYLLLADFFIGQNRIAEAVSLYRLGINRGVMPAELAGRLNQLLSRN